MSGYHISKKYILEILFYTTEYCQSGVIETLNNKTTCFEISQELYDTVKKYDINYISEVDMFNSLKGK